MDNRKPMDYKHIHSLWEEHRLSRKLKRTFPNAALEPKNIHCIKDSFKSSIWKVSLNSAGRSHPVILKIFKPLKRERTESTVETNIYLKANKVLRRFMPKIYHTPRKKIDNNQWVVMEFVKSLQEQIQLTPDHFDYIIPTVAKLHAHTFNEKFYQHNEIFSNWLPQYSARKLRKERRKLNKKTIISLEEAMEIKKLHTLLKPSYNQLKKILKKGPNYFPQLIEAGQSITHNDLQTSNISCHHINKKHWDIRFIDWEGAKFAPCWFDMVNLVGVFLGYRTDWRKNEDKVINRCVHLYAAEMKKRGIIFEQNPMDLYKMAYLQRILEKGLYLQLSWEVSGRKKAYLLTGYLEKINHWGKELRLF